MKKLFVISIFLFCASSVSASSMFDNEGNYSGDWKQMTNVKTSTSSAYKSSDYYSSTWYAQQSKKKNTSNYRETVSSNKNDVTPFRYNTLNYTRVRNMQGSDGKFKSKCMDIGDASFCH